MNPFSDRELFTDHEFRDTCTSALPHVTLALHVASSACSLSIVLWTLFHPWTLYQLWTPWCTHFGSAPYDARTTCGELRWLFFYCTVNSFWAKNSLLTVNSVTHALQLCPIWCMHYVWRAPLTLFGLYCEPFSNHELYDAHTSSLKPQTKKVRKEKDLPPQKAFG